MSDIWIEDSLYNDGLWICGFNPSNCEAWEFVQFENYTCARRQCQEPKTPVDNFCAAHLRFVPEKYQELLTIRQQMPMAPPPAWLRTPAVKTTVVAKPRPASRASKPRRKIVRHQQELIDREFADKARRERRQAPVSDGWFRCRSCGESHPYLRLRVLFKWDEEQQTKYPVGNYCTDCFYCKIDNHQRSERIGSLGPKRSRVLTMDEQQSVDYESMVIRSVEHRDLRWEFGLVGKNTEKYSRAATRASGRRSVA